MARHPRGTAIKASFAGGWSACDPAGLLHPRSIWSLNVHVLSVCICVSICGSIISFFGRLLSCVSCLSWLNLASFLVLFAADP
jgi:hypothetical protein